MTAQNACLHLHFECPHTFVKDLLAIRTLRHFSQHLTTRMGFSFGGVYLCVGHVRRIEVLDQS